MNADATPIAADNSLKVVRAPFDPWQKACWFAWCIGGNRRGIGVPVLVT